MAKKISRYSSSGFDANDPEYRQFRSSQEGHAELAKRATEPLTDRRGREVDPLVGKVKTKWYDREFN